MTLFLVNVQAAANSLGDVSQLNPGSTLMPDFNIGSRSSSITNTVQEIIDPAKLPRNPFNGGSIFLAGPNDPEDEGSVIPGALSCAVAQDQSFQYGNPGSTMSRCLDPTPVLPNIL